MAIFISYPISTWDTHISPRADMGVSGWYGVWYENCHIIIYLSYIFLSDKFVYLILYAVSTARPPSIPNVVTWFFARAKKAVSPTLPDDTGFFLPGQKSLTPTWPIITPFALHKSDMRLKAMLVSCTYAKWTYVLVNVWDIGLSRTPAGYGALKVITNAYRIFRVDNFFCFRQLSESHHFLSGALFKKKKKKNNVQTFGSWFNIHVKPIVVTTNAQNVVFYALVINSQISAFFLWYKKWLQFDQIFHVDWSDVFNIFNLLKISENKASLYYRNCTGLINSFWS